MSRPATGLAIARAPGRCLCPFRALSERPPSSGLSARLGRPLLWLIATAISGVHSEHSIAPSVVVAQSQLAAVCSSEPQIAPHEGVPCLADRPPPRRPVARSLSDRSHSGCAIVVDGRTCSLAGGNAFLRKRFRKRPCPPRSGHDQLQPSHLGLPTYAPSRQLLSHATVYSNLRILICDCLCILIFAMFLELPSHELHTYMY